MNYQSFLIANFATGLDREVQPWLLPNDAFTDLLDGYVYRGVLNKRDGYTGFATGKRSLKTESRMVHSFAAVVPATGIIDGANQTFTWALTPPVAIRRVVISGSNPVQVFTDNGFGYFLAPTVNISAVALTNPAGITTSVNHGYTTGDQVVISSVGGTVQLNRNTAYTITVTGVTTFTLDGIDATAYSAYTSGGTVAKVVGTVNYITGAVSITFPLPPAIASTVLLAYSYHPGLPVMGIMSFYPATNVREMIVADTRYVNKYDVATDTLIDVPAGAYTGTKTDFWSWVNYQSPASAPRLLFANGVAAAGNVIQQYTLAGIVPYPAVFGGVTLNARQIFVFKGRLILFQCIENNILFPRRIRISGFGANCDDFTLASPGANAIDVPDTTWIYGAAFNRDDLLFFTDTSVWALKYTGNDVTPFVLQKLDGSRGSQAAFSAITYLNRTIAVSPRGLIESDGYAVERIDNNIPDYTVNSIDNTQENFLECFSGFIDEDRDVYLIHPSQGVVKPTSVPTGSSDRILVINFEEDNYAVYRIPLSCMGNFQEKVGLIWADLTEANGFPTWDALSEQYDSWAAFPMTKDTPVAIGGGHKGEIWRLNSTESEDNPLSIRAITHLGGNLIRVTTDWNNYSTGDLIAFTGVGGMTEINGQQGFIEGATVDFYTFDVQMVIPIANTYTSGGIAAKVVQLEAEGKKLNPFADQDKKVRCGWMYFYVSTTDTILTETKLDDEGNPVITPIKAFLQVDVLTNNNDGVDFSNPTFRYQVDCTNINREKGGKKWVKIWINQVGQFLQFKLSNSQAGAKIQVHAMMCGFQPVGRLV